MNNKLTRAKSNLAMLEIVAKNLEDLNNEVVYVGGCIAGLLISDNLSLDVRATEDVDCVIDVISLNEYYKFSDRLKEKGFKESMQDDVICRWHHNNNISVLDVMTTDGTILGFGNIWYKEAVELAVTHEISEGIFIKSITAPHFLATKLEAFKGRGKNDFWGSHDFEDIITVIAGRAEIIDEVALSNKELRQYLKENFVELLKNDQFELALPGHLNDGAVTGQRVKSVLGRMKKLTEL